MKSVMIRVHPELAAAIRRIAKTLGIPDSQASVICFFGLQKKSVWEKTFPDAKVNYIRKEVKRKIAMTL